MHSNKISILKTQISKLQSELNEMTLQYQEAQIRYLFEKHHNDVYKSILSKYISDKIDKN